MAGLLHGHFAQTRARATPPPGAENTPVPRLLVVQDTTVLDYSSHFATLDLGPIGNKLNQRGLLAMPPWCCPRRGHRWAWCIWRSGPGTRRCTATVATSVRPRRMPADEKESRKWVDGLRGVEAALGPEVPFLLIQDREADIFDFVSAPRQPNAALLIRAAYPRQVLLQPPPPGQSETRQRAASCTLWAALEATPACGTLRVHVPRAPGRKAREAELELRRLEAWILPPRLQKATEASRQRRPVRVWVVRARGEPAAGYGAAVLGADQHAAGRGRSGGGADGGLLPAPLGDRAVAPGAQIRAAHRAPAVR